MENQHQNSLENIDAIAVADEWLSSFSSALYRRAVEDVISCFQPDGWLKDALVFSWSSRSLHGHERIRDYLASSAEVTLPDVHLSNIRLNTTTRGLEPAFIPLEGKISGTGVRLAFSFETPVYYGRAYSVLRRNAEDEHWRALYVFMQMDEIKGHPPSGPESGVYGGHTLAWEDVWSERRKKIEENPYVLIVGGGQNGLIMGARLKSLNIPTLIIEKHPRVGDVWRMRYPTLSLHTPRSHHGMLFQPFPENWPIFTPRDKLADWLEQYAKSQDLVIWNNTVLESSIKPKYDPSSRRWHLAVTREGKEVVLRPAHIIMATGTLGSPRIPIVKDESLFSGVVYHAAKFQGGKHHQGKRVLVVGVGNTAGDIAQDCVTQGAKEVTLLQRSSTCVISQETIVKMMLSVFPEGENTHVTDFKYHALPIGLMRQWAIENKEKREKMDEDLLKNLVNKGVKINQGRDGSGPYIQLYEKWGGYWIDVGIGELIHTGKAQVFNGAELDHFVPDGVVCTDGRKLEVDVVIYATGYNECREDLKPIFGEEVISKTRSLNVNEEDELGIYNPSGQPGLWFAMGDFAMSRAFSKSLGLQIQSRWLGLKDLPTSSDL